MSDVVRPLDLRSFEEEARAVLEEARARAREILRAAEEEADRVREEARLRGREEGRAEAAAAERERAAREWAGLADLLRAAARGIEERREELAAAAERDLVRLALAVAEKIVRAEVRAGRPVAAASLRRAVELLTRRHRIRVLFHPDDRAVLEACLPALRADFPDLGAVELEGNDAVSRGGCIVTTQEGVVDADLKTQLEEIERGLLG